MLESLNGTLEYIEEHLREPLDVGELARIALTSEYHLRRMFSALAGMPLSEYVRRRRLTMAGAEVVAGERTLLDIAVRYGYGSGEAFARAFRAMHGVGPGEARRGGLALQSQPRMSFRLVVEGRSPMQYRIVTKEQFAVVGRMATVPQIHQGVNPHILEMIKAIEPDTMARIAGLSDQEPSGVISVTLPHDEDNREEGSPLDYYHAVVAAPESGRSEAAAGLDVLEQEAGLWAVFTAIGEFPGALQRMWGDVYSEWFPPNPYRHRPGPSLLKVGVDPDGGGALAELWVAVEPEA
ncbi:AraC family transcriptional regulator [Streptacidiphilus neutrinimicus]|uniref:AraC family transcriptional regulator n=1 Tax=Streptacidiphilus neutrinimicus TaxID=105420 RepID=UPI0005AB2A17|nr:helix-turn-helix domain-containing protein [Streptacidiphilus neutrinimicus]